MTIPIYPDSDSDMIDNSISLMPVEQSNITDGTTIYGLLIADELQIEIPNASAANDTIEIALDKINKLTGMTYTWNDVGRQHGWDPGKEREAGVFAQDVQEVLPEAVRLAPFDNDKGASKSGENFLTVKYEKLVPLLIEAIKEQQSQIEQLKDQVNQLKENN
jgi:hypothetical protein